MTDQFGECGLNTTESAWLTILERYYARDVFKPRQNLNRDGFLKVTF